MITLGQDSASYTAGFFDGSGILISPEICSEVLNNLIVAAKAIEHIVGDLGTLDIVFIRNPARL